MVVCISFGTNESVDCGFLHGEMCRVHEEIYNFQEDTIFISFLICCIFNVHSSSVSSTASEEEKIDSIIFM